MSLIAEIYNINDRVLHHQASMTKAGKHSKILAVRFQVYWEDKTSFSDSNSAINIFVFRKSNRFCWRLIIFIIKCELRSQINDLNSYLAFEICTSCESTIYNFQYLTFRKWSKFLSAQNKQVDSYRVTLHII